MSCLDGWDAAYCATHGEPNHLPMVAALGVLMLGMWLTLAWTRWQLAKREAATGAFLESSRCPKCGLSDECCPGGHA